MPIYDALHDEPSIKTIAVKHEENAAVMADVYGRLTGEPGVCLVTAGPGATNSVTGVAQAFAASSPLVHISGTVSGSDELFHGVGGDPLFLQEMFQRVTKWSDRIESPGRIQSATMKAFGLASAGRKGPIHIEIPLRVQRAECELRQIKPVYPRPKIDRNSLIRAQSVIARAQQYVIFAGEEVLRYSASSELLELAEAIGAPVVVSDSSIDAFPHDHPLFAGYLPGNYDGPYRNPIVQTAVKKADLMLLVGARLEAPETSIILSLGPKKCVNITSERTSHRVRVPMINVVGNIARSLTTLVELVGSSQQKKRPESSLLQDLAQQKQMISQALERIISDKVTAAPIHPGLVAATVRRLTDRHAIIATDVGTHAIWVRDYFHAYEPNTYLETGNYGSMGFALPAAIAAKLVRPEQQVVAVTGDGGFLMSLADLPTAVENRLNIVVVVMNDSKYGMIWRMQEEEYRGRHIGVDLAPSNFASLAQSFGAAGVRIDDPRDLAPALREALTDDKMTVIDVLTDHRPDYACREIFKHTPSQAGS